jgi:hypothetical protein
MGTILLERRRMTRKWTKKDVGRKVRRAWPDHGILTRCASVSHSFSERRTRASPQE